MTPHDCVLRRLHLRCFRKPCFHVWLFHVNSSFFHRRHLSHPNASLVGAAQRQLWSLRRQPPMGASAQCRARSVQDIFRKVGTSHVEYLELTSQSMSLRCPRRSSLHLCKTGASESWLPVACAHTRRARTKHTFPSSAPTISLGLMCRGRSLFLCVPLCRRVWRRLLVGHRCEYGSGLLPSWCTSALLAFFFLMLCRVAV